MAARSSEPGLILHVVHSLDGGGTARALLGLLRSFAPVRFRHAVVTLREAGTCAAELPDHVSCYPLTAAPRDRRVWWRIARIARHARAAVIHARNTGCWADATLTRLLRPRARLVLGYHGLDQGASLTAAQRRKTRLGLAAGARFACVAASGAERLAREVGVARSKIVVLPNGVDVNAFQPPTESQRAEARRRWDCPPHTVVVAGLGSLTPIKRYDLLLRAFAKAARAVPNMLLVIAGDGPLAGPLRGRAAELGVTDRVRWLGQRRDVAAVLAGVDIYACTSSSEEMSNALLEAMACGVAVISTTVGDHAALLHGGRCGLLVPPPAAMSVREDSSLGEATPSFSAHQVADDESVSRLADTLAALATDERRRRELGTAARQRAMDFRIDSCAARYEAFYEALCRRGDGSGLRPL
jgi:glycosyltransferase involved in cell wall biosynthesis